MEPALNPTVPSAFQDPPVGSDSDPRMTLALALCKGIGATTFHRLLAVFGSPEAVFAAPDWELKEACPRLGAGTFIDIRRGPDFRELEWQESECRRLGARLLGWRSPGYPTPLLDLECPPPILFMLGEWLGEDRRALAVVGTRNPSPYGERSARDFGLRLGEAGWTVVSGLARGVDTLAHETALRGGSRTVAVLGSGLDRLYPRENEDLARRIAAGRGCVISEFPMGVEPRPENFPRRNRIISGLSMGTLVVEAGNDSGALITAEFALEQGREVFAVPGAILAPGTRGTHKLIKEGAHLVERVEDIQVVLEGLAQAAPGRRLPARRRPEAVQARLFDAPGAPGESAAGEAVPEEVVPGGAPESGALDLKASHRELLESLGSEAVSLDGIAERMRARPGRSALPAHRLLAELLQLELLGLVRRMPGAVFRRARE